MNIRPAVVKAAEAALGAGAAGAGKVLKRVYDQDPEAAVAAAKEVGKAAFKVVAAAALGYELGLALNSFDAYMAPDVRKARLAQAYKHARMEAAGKLGRELTLEETAAMGRTFKAAVAKIDAGEKYKTTLDNFLR